jgi:hypothetical protein
MEAIVLSRRDFREYDQIITVYTKEQGKLELLARGVKKIVSKNTAHLEPFSYGMIESVPGKEILHLTTAQPLHTFPFIRSNLEFFVLEWDVGSSVYRLNSLVRNLCVFCFSYHHHTDLFLIFQSLSQEKIN